MKNGEYKRDREGLVSKLILERFCRSKFIFNQQWTNILCKFGNVFHLLYNSVSDTMLFVCVCSNNLSLHAWYSSLKLKVCNVSERN